MNTRRPVIGLALVAGIIALGASGRAGNLTDPLEGVVLDAGGEPVPWARVELTAGGEILAGVHTDARGRFHVEPRSEWSEAWRLRVERMGYETAEVPVPAGSPFLEIILTVAPLPLPGFLVDVDPGICEDRDEAGARALWEAASRRHPSGLDTLGVASYTRVRTDTLTDGPSGREGIAGTSPGQRGSAPLLRMSWTRRIDRAGYGFPVRRSDRERSYDSWSYPPLEADFAPHFGSHLFGQLHRFRLEAGRPDGWTLSFCGRRQDGPHLTGVIELGPDTLMRRVEWRFVTPDPDEGAGGWVRFPLPEEEHLPPVLLPVESMIWRDLPDGRTVRRAQWYEGWIHVAGDSVPFLPRRAAGDRPGR